MSNVFDVLKERGFIEQTTHDDELRNHLIKNKVVCYVGFDPTAFSLHVGNLLPIMGLLHMKMFDHFVIALVGGGTALIGDPSGKNDLRKMMNSESIISNASNIKNQLRKIIKIRNDKDRLVNNINWLEKENYISFLRKIGRYFSVNKMIKAESYKNRLDSEVGLSFIEFNYMLLQAYDFSKLYHTYGCSLQIGGSDQWGNILAGMDLVKKKYNASVFGITFPLITTSNGIKMGKTNNGAVWLDANMTSAYEYYQYWINVDDADLERFMALFTFLPISEINKIKFFTEEEMNIAKRILAFEATSLVHGEAEAIKAYSSSSSLFGDKRITSYILPSSKIHNVSVSSDESLIPSYLIDLADLVGGIPAFRLFTIVGLQNSGSSSKRLIEQGGGYVNGERVVEFDQLITIEHIKDNCILLRAGKKRFLRVNIKNK